MKHKNLRIINHPLAAHKLGPLRNKETSSSAFRSTMNEVARILAYEATRDLQTHDEKVESPLATTLYTTPVKWPIIMSVLRAGNGLLDGLLSFLPEASAGHIGIYRDKFIGNTVEYYFKLPEDHKGRNILVSEPMIATGDTIVACIDRLKKFNVGKITILSVLVGPEGMKKLEHFHPDVEVLALSLEEGLNSKGYLVPGLGDAGDRIYQTK